MCDQSVVLIWFCPVYPVIHTCFSLPHFLQAAEKRSEDGQECDITE